MRDLRVAEVVRQDVTIENGQVKNFPEDQKLGMDSFVASGPSMATFMGT